MAILIRVNDSKNIIFSKIMKIEKNKRKMEINFKQFFIRNRLAFIYLYSNKNDNILEAFKEIKKLVDDI